MSSRRRHLFAALVGLVAAVVTLGVAEVIALLVAPLAGPLVVVGSLVIDIVPPWVKETAIALFGTNDKIALIVSLGLLVAILAAAVGILEYRKPPFGMVGLVLVGAVATTAALTRAGADLAWALPTVVGAIAGLVLLRLATRRLRFWLSVEPSASEAAVLSRRGFVGLLAASAGAAAVAGLAARVVNAATSAANMAREALVLPRPAVAAAAIPAGADLDVAGITPLVTGNDVFYRIDTALQIPRVTTADWRLRITGMVEQEVEIGFDELVALPLIETYVTLACVSNEVGGGLIGNARWMGYPIRELLRRAKPEAGADMVLSRSADGWTASTPLSVLLEKGRDSILAVSMNDEPLPLEHGFPVRMVVPGLYGYVSATKWVTELKVTRFADETAYWTDRGWSAQGPIKLSSRIDVPRYSAIVPLEPLAIAGVAWAQHTGVQAVEVRIDEGDWMPTTLAPAISDDTWVQWFTEWTPTEQKVYLIEARATDKNGMAQSGDRVFVAPDGAEGWHSVTIEARA